MFHPQRSLAVFHVPGLAVAFVLIALAPVRSGDPVLDSEQRFPVEQVASEEAGLHNVLMLGERIISGSEPATAAAFQRLKSLGVTAVVSVDGARPHIELARQSGMRYIHIPIGYDGVSSTAAAAIARVVQDIAGPIYFHCHHGRHRGPAAAAIACVIDEQISSDQALRLLEIAGTSREYAGLWRDVGRFQPLAADTRLPELVEVAPGDPLAMAMSSIDHAHDVVADVLQRTDLAAEDWQLGAEQATLIREGFREFARHLTGNHDPRAEQAQLREWLQESETRGQQLAHALRKNDRQQALDVLTHLNAHCAQCHKQFRD